MWRRSPSPIGLRHALPMHRKTTRGLFAAGVTREEVKGLVRGSLVQGGHVRRRSVPAAGNRRRVRGGSARVIH